MNISPSPITIITAPRTSRAALPSFLAMPCHPLANQYIYFVIHMFEGQAANWHCLTVRHRPVTAHRHRYVLLA